MPRPDPCIIDKLIFLGLESTSSTLQYYNTERPCQKRNVRLLHTFIFLLTLNAVFHLASRERMLVDEILTDCILSTSDFTVMMLSL